LKTKGGESRKRGKGNDAWPKNIKKSSRERSTPSTQGEDEGSSEKREIQRRKERVDFSVLKVLANATGTSY